MWGVIALTVARRSPCCWGCAGSSLREASSCSPATLPSAGWWRSRPDRDGDVYFVRFEVGGPGVFHNVAVQLLGVKESAEGVELERPAVRHTMAAGDDPIEWTFHLSGEAAERAWVMVTWVRPYIAGRRIRGACAVGVDRSFVRMAVVLRDDALRTDRDSVHGATEIGAGGRIDARPAAVWALAAHVVEHQRRPAGPGDRSAADGLSGFRLRHDALVSRHGPHLAVDVGSVRSEVPVGVWPWPQSP